jgi:hypothetical protein
MSLDMGTGDPIGGSGGGSGGQGVSTYTPSIYQDSPSNRLYENRLEIPTAQDLSYDRTNVPKETPRQRTNPWSYSTN